MPEATRRPNSLVSDRAITQNVISPGLNAATPTWRGMSSHCGGRIDETETRFCCSISASRSAYSKAASCWRWTPTPRVRKTRLGSGNIVRPSFGHLIPERSPYSATTFRSTSISRFSVLIEHSLSKRRQPLLSLLLYPTRMTNWRRFRASPLLRGLRPRRGLLAAPRTKLGDPARDDIEDRREDQAEGGHADHAEEHRGAERLPQLGA